jgi:hypothetical protein
VKNVCIFFHSPGISNCDFLHYRYERKNQSIRSENRAYSRIEEIESVPTTVGDILLGVFLGCCLGIGIGGCIWDSDTKKDTYQTALLGDKEAIELLKTNRDKYWAIHEFIVKEALDGNDNAINLLRLNGKTGEDD